MHAAVYARRPDVNAIIHTHQPYASALALVRRPIPALFDEQVRFLGRSVEIVDYAPSGTSFLRKNVEKAVGSNANAYILANHGVLVLGGDPERAAFNMALLEKVALDYLLALMTGEKVRKVPAPDPRGRLRQAAQGREEAEEAARGGARGGRGGGGRGRRRRRRGGRAGGGRGRPAAAPRRPSPQARGRRRGAGRSPADRRPARWLRDQRVPGREGRVRAPRRARAPAHPPAAARRHGGGARLLRDEVPPQPRAHRRGR